MSTELTQKAQTKADGQIQEPQLVLKIDGVETIYGVGEIKKYVKIGDEGLFIDGSWTIGGLNAYADQLDVIDIEGSSNSLTQQLLQDKGGTTSVPSFSISLIDKDQKITELITPSLVVEDILGREAEVYLGYRETAWPQDFVRIISGIIDEVTGGTTIVLNVAHPEQKKRADIFKKYTTELTEDFNFRSKRIQKILYKTRRDVVGIVTVTYVSGATVGNEIVSVAGNNITVQIQAGVTQAQHIRNKIERSIDALSLVEIKIDQNGQNEPQTLQPSTNLDSDTTANVTTTKGFLLPVPSEGFRTYFRVNDEVVEYTGLTDTTITGCVRGALSLVDERAEGTSHETEDSVDTFYRIEGNAFDIALKVLMSGGPQYFAEDIQIKSIVEVEGVGTVPNAVWFEFTNIEDAWGITVGDRATITGDAVPSNNVTLALISDVIATPLGSYIILDGAGLTPQVLSTGKISFASKYNVLPKGAGVELGGNEVDVPEFERLRDIFGSSIFTYDYYLKDTVTAKQFVDTKILFPTGAFSLPRRGKISVGYTSPPLGGADIKVLDSTNTSKPSQNRIKRSINRYFYNNVVFRYNQAVVDDKFLTGDVQINQDSKNRIPIGDKTLVIDAEGLRPSADTTVIIDILKKRFEDKYKFGAEVITTFAFYGKTFNTDVGDIVVFGDSMLQLPDTKQGTRNFQPRLFEVQNKALAIKSGEVKLELIDSGYSIEDGRYGIMSPSSQTVAVGSSGSQIKIKNSYETVFPQLERTKWSPYVNQRCLIHDENYDFLFETKFLGFSPSDNYLMLFEDVIPFAIGNDYVVDIAFYPDNNDPEDHQLPKRVFVFTDPTVEILSGISQTEFTVSGLDISLFRVGAILLVRDTEWDIYSDEVKITDITGSTITVSAPLGFIPLAGYEIDLIGFKDKGAPYRFL